MLQPPVSDLTPWLPGHWITQTGYALNEKDVDVGVKDDRRCVDMQTTVSVVDSIMEKVMCK
jgi:hypothetical protein